MRRSLRLSALCLPLLLASLPSCGTEAKAEEVLQFTAIPDENQTELQARYQAVAEYLGKTLGIRVEYRPTSSYSASVEQFVNGDIQLAWFGGLSGAQARARVPGARAIAMGAKDLAFKSYFIARKETGIPESREQGAPFPKDKLAGLEFSFGSRGSTSGRLMPQRFLEQETGKTPAKFFGQDKISFSGAHDKTVMVVQADNGPVAGVLSYSTYEKMEKAGKIDTDKVHVIWVTPSYADYNLTAHPELEKRFGEGFIDKLKKAFLEMPSDMSGRFDRKKMIAADNETFSTIHDLAQKLDLLKK